jgi:hypothetical protein
MVGFAFHLEREKTERIKMKELYTFGRNNCMKVPDD